MLRVILRRLASVAPMLFIVTLVVFFMVELIPGDIAAVLAGDDTSPATIARIRRELGLDQPAVLRYFDWIGGMLRGDFGRSLFSGERVGAMIAARLPVTLSLTLFAVVFALLIGVPFGVIGANTRSPLVDRLLTSVLIFGVSVPSYVFGVLFVLVLALQLQLFPVTGYRPLTMGPLHWAYALVLPGLALSFTPAAVVARQLRGSLIDVMKSDYIKTARAKGLRRGHIIAVHAIRNAAPPALNALGIQVAILLSGAVAIEIVFALPGLGQLAISAVGVRDLPIIQGVVIAGALAVILVNLLVDILQTLLNPRAGA